MPEENKRTWTIDITRILCGFIALYFLYSVSFALFHANDFASETPQIIRYVIGPGVIGAGFLACTIWASHETRAVVGACGIAVLGGMFAFETVMAARTYSAIAGMVAAPSKEWLRQERAERALPPSRTPKALNVSLGVRQLSSAILSGIPEERVALCTRDGQHIFYQADRFGFNNPDSAYQRPTDILVLGDSFVEGICLEPGKDLVGRVRDGNPATIGIGSRGSGPLFEVAMLGRYGSHLRPKKVVMAFFEGNDWENLEKELQQPYMRQALAPSPSFGPVEMSPQTEKRAESVISSWLSQDTPGFVQVLQRTRSLRNFGALHNTALQLGIAYPKAAPRQDEYVNVLARTKALTESWGGKLYLLYIPARDRYVGIFNRDFVYDQVRSQVVAAAVKNNVPVIDLAMLFRSMPNPDEFYGSEDSHFSESGAKVAAKAILEKVSAKPDRMADARPLSALQP